MDRPVIIPGDGNRLMQFVYVNDLVEACFNALQKHTAPGRSQASRCEEMSIDPTDA